MILLICHRQRPHPAQGGRVFASSLQYSRVHLIAFVSQPIKCAPTMTDFRDKLPAKWKNYDFTNVIGLLLLMKEIQEQEPLDELGVLKIDEDGTRLY